MWIHNDTETYFSIHVESIHDGIEYDCKQSDYKARQNSALKTHMRQHEGKFSCSKCTKTCSSEDRLKIHIAMKQNGSK